MASVPYNHAMNAPTTTALTGPLTAANPPVSHREVLAAAPPGLSSLAFESSFAALGSDFATPVAATPLPAPYLVAASPGACALIGVDPAGLADDDAVAMLAGNREWPGSRPVATVYAGHQFGVWAGRLGDGRALLLGDVPAQIDAGPAGGEPSGVGPASARFELQLKGAGKTPYSRMGDGRAVLRSSIREFLCSEAMAALGVPTTRALAVSGADAPVFRETVESAAVVVRMAPSFVRFGHFEYFHHFRKPEQLRQLADFVIDRHFPAIAGLPDRYAAFLADVSARTGRLIAQWQSLGFCHGVLNTDNLSILGLTIDYGPFGFLDGFDVNHICNHSDDSGRYAYARQPEIGEWNCYALGQTLVGLIGSVGAAEAALGAYRPAFRETLQRLLRAKLGLTEARPDDDALFDQMFAAMDHSRVDFTLFFRALAGVSRTDVSGDGPVRDLFIDRETCDGWLARYRARLGAEPAPEAERRQAMNRVNPRFVLRNHLAQIAIRQAEQAIAMPAAERDLPGGFAETRRLATVLARPFDDQPGHEAYAALPPDWAGSLEVSCSS